MTNKLKISKRITEIASVVPENCILGDIGADHGYLICYLLMNNIISKGYASDNKKGPYNRLKNTVCEYGLSSFAECALKDGLNDLPAYVNTVSITGMGGELIISIIDEGKKYLNQIERFILSPQGGEEKLRHFMSEIGYYPKSEKIISDYKFYEITLYEKGKLPMDDLDFKFGYHLRRELSPVFKEKYSKEIENINKIMTFDIDTDTKNRLTERKKEILSVLKKE